MQQPYWELADPDSEMLFQMKSFKKWNSGARTLSGPVAGRFAKTAGALDC